MGLSFLSQLIEFITSPWGILILSLSLLLVYQARSSPQLAWLMVSLCGFSAALMVHRSIWIPNPPPLVFPLQQIRESGRPLTVILLGLILLLGLWTPAKWRKPLMPTPLKYLMLLQAVIVLKTLIQGDFVFAFLSFTIFFGLVLAIQLGPNQWLQDEQSFVLGVRSLAIASLIFVGASLYQALYDYRPLAITNNWFHGLSGNPQQVAILLSASVPSFVFLIERQQRWDIQKLFWIISLTLIMIALFLTASRTGAVMGVAAILFFYRHRSGALLRFALLIAIPLVLVWLYATTQQMDLGMIDSASSAIDKYLSNRNTRAGVWSGLWQAFIDYPLLGAPLRGTRLSYGENSWLATAATLGLLGLIPLMLFGLSSLKMLFSLNQITHQYPHYCLHSDVVIAGITALFVGSISEAHFLGNLTFPILALLIYLVLGQYIIDVVKVEAEYHSWQIAIET